jgi:la-related protein 1
LDKTKSKKNVSSSSQGTTIDSNHNSDTKEESDHRNNTNHSSVSTKKEAMVTSSTSDNATSSNTTSNSPKKKVAKQVANNMKSNISSNKTKTNNKTKKNANKKKNKSNKNHVGKMNNNAYYYVPAPEEMEALKLAAVVQIEYFFSIDELVRNIYLRKQMDCEGYLPAAVVFNFPSVLSYCIPYYDLLAAVDVHAQTIEVDFENECLRLKGGEAVYKKWLMPNPNGTLGCAKWIKEVPQFVEENSSVPFDAAESVSTGLMRGGESLNKVSASMEEEKKEDDERDSHVLANHGDQ